MEHAILLVVLLCVYAIRDAQVIACTRFAVLRFSLAIYSICVVVFLSLVCLSTAEIDEWQYFNLLRLPAFWIPCVLYHLTIWVLHRRSVRVGAYRIVYVLDALPTPILLLSLAAAVHATRQTSLNVALLWIAAVATLVAVLRKRPFIEETFPFAWELSENANAFALILIPFDRLF